MKIITVTANPCVDRTVWVEEFEKGGTNRVSNVVESINGKGINTSVAVHKLGYPTLAVVVEYTEGESVCRYLSSIGVDNACIETSGKLRVNTKIFDRAARDITELNCKGYPVPSETEDRIIEKVMSVLEKGDILIVSGSVPPGIGVDFYRKLIIQVKGQGGYVILDADGELLLNGIEGCPDMIKPNRDELSRIYGGEIRDVDEAIQVARGLLSRGVGSVCISFGAKGSMYVTGDKVYWADSLNIEVKGTVGAGDSMVAGFAIGHLNGISEEECFRTAVAVASGSVSLEGTEVCDQELYEKMLPLVLIEEI